MSQEILVDLPSGLAIGQEVVVIYSEQNAKSGIDEGWYAMPSDFKREDLPEGFLVGGRGTVTKYDFESPRSLEGKQFIVVNKHIYVGYKPEYWR